MHSVLAHQTDAAKETVSKISPDTVLSTPVADLAESVFRRDCIEPIVLHMDRRSSNGAKDVTIAVQGFDGPIKVAGTRVEVLIPFTGDVGLFDVRPSTRTLNPPRFAITDHSIVAAVEGRSPLDPLAAKRFLDELIAAVEQHLGWQRSEIDPWNEQLKSMLPGLIEARRAKVLQDRAIDAFLDVPVVGRPNPSPSFAIDPPKRPRPSVVKQTHTAPFAPEPAISDAGFDDILAEIESVTTAVQRLPKTFATMPEESLRDVLLVVLNNRFGPASGETFSRRGKTDIFIPIDGDQRCVFIAECKWWKGPAGFRKAIDQLRGYLTWRDTRAALIVFIKSGSPTDIRESGASELRAHDAFKRETTVKGRTLFTFASSDDDNREIHLALVLVPVLP